MSLIAKIYNTIKPCIAKFVGLIDVILMLISGLVTSIVLLGVAMVQEQKIRQQEQQTPQTGPVPTEEELAAWTLMAGYEEQDEQCMEEIIEELQLEQKMVTALETPHPHSLGDHNVHEDLSELMLSQETVTPEEEAQK